MNNIDIYYERRHDGYNSLHFANKKGMSVDEIKDFFSQFGEIMYVNCAGDDYGFRFVTFRNEDDIKRCILELRNHEHIKILPKRDKINANKENKQTDPQRNSNRKNGGGSDKKNKTHSIKKDNDTTPNDVIRNNDEFSDTSSRDSKHRVVPTTPNQNSLAQFEKLQKMRGLAANSFHPDIPSSTIQSNQQEQENKEEDRMPELVSADTSAMLESHASRSPMNSIISQTKILPAHEVVVANIHPNLGIHYILHLFEKYNPICITTMKTVPRDNIRYCHVYFKTPQEALAIEKEFDKTVLCGLNIIALRPQKLLEELNS